MSPGDRVDRYILESLLGRGGMAEVWAAKDTQLRRLVALKRLKSSNVDRSAAARFTREARAAAAFQHPGAVVVYDVFEHEGTPYIAMELVPGRTLRTFVGDASIPSDRRIRWLIDIARALGAAHRAGLVHRDVKPHNVVVRDDGAVKVLDFGIARLERPPKAHASGDTQDSFGGITAPGVIMGTPLYASPEQIAALPVDGRSDQFSWAVMGFELMCGLLPWRRRDTMTMLGQLVAGDIPSMADRIAEAKAAVAIAEAARSTSRSGRESTTGDRASISVPPPPDPQLYDDLPPELDACFQRALGREPEDRYPTMDDVADELEPFAEPVRSVRLPTRSASQIPLDLTPSAAPSEAPEGETPTSEVPSSQTPSSQTLSSYAGPSIAPTQLAPVTPPAAPSPPGETGDRQTLPAPGHGAEGPEPHRAPEPSRPAPEPKAPLWRRPWSRVAGAAVLMFGAWLALSRAMDLPTATPQGAPAGSQAGPPAPPKRAPLPPIGCVPAKIEGPFTAPNGAMILGVAACARLALALGQPWILGEHVPARAEAVVTFHEGAVSARVAWAGRSGEGQAPTPLAAIGRAADSLAEGMDGADRPALTVAPWGTADEGEARRLQRAYFHQSLQISANAIQEVAGLADRTSEMSPWPFVFRLTQTAPGDPRAADDRNAALARIDRSRGALPPARAAAARGAALWFGPLTAADRIDAIAALRHAYTLSDGDALVAALNVTALFEAGLTDEAQAIAARFADRPTADAVLVASALARCDDPDPSHAEDRSKMFADIERSLPESAAWDARIFHEAALGHLDAARSALDLGAALGTPSELGSLHGRSVAAAVIALAASDPEQARTLVKPALGAPHPVEADRAIDVVVQSFLLQGRTSEAETALARDIQRQEAIGNARRATERRLALLGIRRRLGLKPPAFLDLAALDQARADLEHGEDPLAVTLRVEIWAARAASGKPKDGEAEIAEIEAFSRKVARGDQAVEHDLLTLALPIVLGVRGAEGALTYAQTLAQARFRARLATDLVRGHACIAQGDLVCAKAAFERVARTPLHVNGLDHVAAKIQLAAMLQKKGDSKEAAAISEAVGALLTGADAGVRQALERRPF